MMQDDPLGRKRKMIHVRFRAHCRRKADEAETLHRSNGKFEFLAFQPMPIQYFIEIEEDIALECFGLQRAQ